MEVKWSYIPCEFIDNPDLKEQVEKEFVYMNDCYHQVADSIIEDINSWNETVDEPHRREMYDLNVRVSIMRVLDRTAFFGNHKWFEFRIDKQYSLVARLRDFLCELSMK